MASEHVIAAVTEEDLAELLPLMRAYCDFYGVGPPAGDLLDMSRALIGDPAREGRRPRSRGPGRTGAAPRGSG